LPIETLLGKHPSIPYNPLLAAAFFRAGYIEAWGRGIEKIETACTLADTRMPEIIYKFGGVLVTFTGDVMGKGMDVFGDTIIRIIRGKYYQKNGKVLGYGKKKLP
jgi:predicted HTH transcriptional regulator